MHTQGAKSAQKRERAAKNAGKEAKSQLKVNESAKDIQCKVCFGTFLKTTRAPAYVIPHPYPSTVPTRPPYVPGAQRTRRANKIVPTNSLKVHAENKHSKTLEECFPDSVPSA